MKKYFFLFLASLIIISALRQTVGVTEPIKAHEFFNIISDINLTPDHQIDAFFEIRDYVYEILRMIRSTTIPGADAWSSGDQSILSFLKMIAEVIFDVGVGILSIVPITNKLVEVVLMILVEGIELIYEFFRLVLRLLGLWFLK